MVIKEQTVDDIRVLTLKGNLMGGADNKIINVKIGSLLNDNVRKFVIDLGKIKWINSTGMGILCACYASVVKRDGEIKLARSTRKLKSLLIVSQLVKVFDSFESVQEAVNSFEPAIAKEAASA